MVYSMIIWNIIYFFGDSGVFSSIVNDPFLFNSNVTLVNVLDPLESPNFSPKLYMCKYFLYNLIYLNSYKQFSIHTNR